VENQRDMQRRLFLPARTLLRGPPAYQPRTPWGAAMASLVAAAIVALSAVCAALFMIAFWRNGGASAPLPGRGMSGVEANIAIRMFAIWQLAVVLLTILASARGRVQDVLALHPVERGWRAYAGALLALVALQAVLALLQHWVVRHDMLTDLRPFVDLIRGEDWLLTAAVIGIGAPLSEELLFRGFLLAALARTSLGFWGAAFVSTALWTALHYGYSLMGIIEVFVIGLFFSWLLWRTGSLRVPIFCHALYNSLIVVVLRLVDLPPPG
jgi:membrane protease YdiL (CAAX protease family)